MSLTTDFSSLTFEEVKNQIINQMKNNPNFLDYDFTGSRLNVLIDALAYSTIYQGSYANAAVIESWKQLALRRESVVQGAQEVGYVPSSKTAAKANIKLTAVYDNSLPTPPTYVVIQRGTKFSGQKGNTTFKFVSTQDITIPGSSTFVGEFQIVQGQLLQNTYTWTANQRIFLKSPDTDRRYTKVTVNGEEWKLADNAARVQTNGKVFYMRETLDGWTEVYFGVSNLTSIDGQPDLSMYVGGLTPNVSDTVVVEYLTTDGDAANGISSFKILSAIPYFTTTVTDVIDVSYGGGEKEDIERIRTVSDRMWQAQNRCVTPPDYENFVLAEFGYLIDAIRVWTQRGVTGYAYIAIKPKNALQLTTSQIESIGNYLKKYNVSVVEPKFVTPVYIFINHTVEVDYDPNLLDITEDQLKSNILLSMENYYKLNVNSFGDGYQNSKLTAIIDSTHKSILGTQCDIDVVKEFTPSAFWNSLSKGSSLSANTISKGLITYPFTYEEYDEDGMYVNTHELRVYSTESGKLVLGPFYPTAVPISISYPTGWKECQIIPCDEEPGVSGVYTLRDFDEPEYENNDQAAATKFYQIGTIDEINAAGGMTFTQINFTNQTSLVRWELNNIKEDSIKYMISVNDTSIYPSQGEIIVFDQYLRPEYITLTPHPILS